MTPTEVRFAADGMLQSLATWLRLLGYDCLTHPGQSGRALLEQAVSEDRVFLTRNAHLPDNLPRALLARGRIVHVLNDRLPDQLREVVTRYSLDTDAYVFTRCLECNGLLQGIDRSEAIGHVPEGVVTRETGFWRCRHCGKMFWRGSHVKNTWDRLRRWFPAQK